MGKRVAICAVAQIKNEGDLWYARFQNMLKECFESIMGQTGVSFDMEKGIRNIITCSDDVFGRPDHFEQRDDRRCRCTLPW